MKKILGSILLAFVMLFSFSDYASAASCTVKANTCDESCTGGAVQADGSTTGGTRKGLVPCGINNKNWDYVIRAKATATVPEDAPRGLRGTVQATSYNDALAQTNTTGTTAYGANNYDILTLVTNSGSLACRCELYHVFILGLNIYSFTIWDIATPLAGLLIVFGGILMLASGINPKWYDAGKTMLWGAAIGLGFIFGSWIIIDIVLKAIGYSGAGSWFNF